MVIAKFHELLIRVPILDIYFQSEEESFSDQDQHESVSGNVTQSLPVPGLILFKHDCKKCCWLFSSVS